MLPKVRKFWIIQKMNPEMPFLKRKRKEKWPKVRKNVTKSQENLSKVLKMLPKEKKI